MLPSDGPFPDTAVEETGRVKWFNAAKGTAFSHGGMNVEKPLRGSRRLEPLHLALSSPHDLMGVFSAIVFSEASIMRAGEAQLPESRAVGAQREGDGFELSVPREIGSVSTLGEE
jgi:hypothetical protein